MKKILTILILFIFSALSAQTAVESQTDAKDRRYVKERTFSENPKNKYASDNAFNYKEEIPEEKVEKKDTSPKTTSSGGGTGLSLLGNLLPWILVFILIGIVIVAILKGAGMTSIGMKKYKTPEAEKLISDEEDLIEEGEFEKLLKRAVQNGNFRLATRYYYLWLLQQLSEKKYIEYHKEKTNTEYLFELEDKNLRSGFSYLSYIYSYVWYGEFLVDAARFDGIAKKYKSFMNQIK